MRTPGNLFRTSTGVIVVLAVASLLPRNSSNATEKKSAAPARAYYLTKEAVDGSRALTACAAGFHMAGLAEIRETSTLRYDVALGRTADDSGFGPSWDAGWIRSGTEAFNTFNCNLWTSNNALDRGFVAVYKPPASPTLDWVLRLDVNCDGSSSGLGSIGVWCVQD